MRQNLVILVLLLMISPVIAQTGPVEVGKSYTVYLKDSTIVKGKITSVDEKKIGLKLNKGKLINVYEWEEILRVEENHFAIKGSVGIGVGVPYGIVGLNGEWAFLKHFSLSGGIGTTVYAGIGYAIGARAYLWPTGEIWRPRISVHYGVNSTIAEENLFEGEAFAGLTIGAGLLAMFGEKRRHGFDIEFAFFATRGNLENRIEELNNSGNYAPIETPGRFGVVIGYRFGF